MVNFPVALKKMVFLYHFFDVYLHYIKNKPVLKTLRPKLALGSESMRLELEISPGSTPAENVAEAILLLDKLFFEKKQRAVI